MNQDIDVAEVVPEKTSADLVTKPLDSKPELPLFLREDPENNKGEAQDEKDKSAE